MIDSKDLGTGRVFQVRDGGTNYNEGTLLFGADENGNCTVSEDLYVGGDYIIGDTINFNVTKIGINTTTPIKLLTVNGGCSISAELLVDTVTVKNALYAENLYANESTFGDDANAFVFGCTGEFYYHPKTTQVSNNIMGWIDEDGDNYLLPVELSNAYLSSGNIATARGNIGIGTTSPGDSLVIGGCIALKEVATSPDTTANYGKLFIKSADNALYFLDSTGAETLVISTTSGAAATYWDITGSTVKPKSTAYNVTIGQSADVGESLSIAGDIRCDSLAVAGSVVIDDTLTITGITASGSHNKGLFNIHYVREELVDTTNEIANPGYLNVEVDVSSYVSSDATYAIIYMTGQAVTTSDHSAQNMTYAILHSMSDTITDADIADDSNDTGEGIYGAIRAFATTDNEAGSDNSATDSIVTFVPLDSNKKFRYSCERSAVNWSGFYIFKMDLLGYIE
jgi:hypothetical protein